MVDKGSQMGGMRLFLERSINPKNDRSVVFIMLNPSTATETENDPTIRRCIRFARDWGYGHLYVNNIFAMRATRPHNLHTAAENPVGQGNDAIILLTAQTADLVVCAWGAHGKLYNRGEQVIKMLQDNDVPLHCLGTTKDGQPRHPLYVAATTQPQPFREPYTDTERIEACIS